jgi:hypothetical protein
LELEERMSKHGKITFLIPCFVEELRRNEHEKATFLIGKILDSISSEGGRLEGHESLWNIMRSHLNS